MYERVDLFSYLAENSNEHLIPALADGLKKHCQKWGYDFVDKLRKNATPESFIKIFCKITYTYFFEHEEEMYGAKFSKSDLSVRIYKCGKNHERILIECPISDVLKELYCSDGEVKDG